MTNSTDSHAKVVATEFDCAAASEKTTGPEDTVAILSSVDRIDQAILCTENLRKGRSEAAEIDATRRTTW